jgi:circadian clock protein KaiB
MKCILRLYITGCSLASQHAVVNLRLLCQDELLGLCEFEIIDILENPEIAEQEKILATPTLVKRFPAPVRKVIGDLSQRDKVLFGLGLDIRKPGWTDDPELLGDVSEKEVDR